MQVAGWRASVLGAVPVLLYLPYAAFAESSNAKGQAGLSAAASVKFKIVIPEVLALSVGAGTLNPSHNSSMTLPGARSGIKLPNQPEVALRSNMRLITVTQDAIGQAAYTAAAP